MREGKGGKGAGDPEKESPSAEKKRILGGQSERDNRG